MQCVPDMTSERWWQTTLHTFERFGQDKHVHPD